MNKRIHLLDEMTINKIAAGEVVDGPYSVVKELVENAIDAQATSIVLEIKEGGKQYIRISDNGIGIGEEEVELAFMRHSTSKITSIEDLNDNITLGFRGEALASIASVAQVEIITRPEHQQHGLSLEIVGGKILSKKQVGCPKGTTLIIKNLFFNTPARLKFMKSTQGESTKINEIISRLALSNPQITFKYINNNNIMFTTPGNNKLSEVILSVFDKEMYKSLIAVNEEDDQLKINGFVSQLDYVRGNRNLQILFVNGRYVKSKMISKALEDAYRGSLPINKYPICVINLELPGSQVDINVHPAKTEVKFHDDDRIYDFIYKHVQAVLHRKTVMPTIGISNKKMEQKEDRFPNTSPVSYRESLGSYTNVENKSESSSNNNEVFTRPIPSKDINIKQEIPQEENNDTTLNWMDSIALEESSTQYGEQISAFHEGVQEETQGNFLNTVLADAKIIGQLFNTYILIENNEQVYLIDQHAAHEKLIYVSFLQQIQGQKVDLQPLLVPYVLELSMEDFSFLHLYLSDFKRLGFTIEPFGQNTVIIREVPLVLGAPENFSFIVDTIDELRKSKYSLNQMHFEERIIQKACKEAIKAKDALHNKEIEQLLKNLAALAPPLTCPHGRPIVLTLSKYELEKYFKRIQ